MKKDSFKQGLIGLITGVSLLFNSGCNSGPQKDFFGAPIGATEKKIATFPPGLPLMAIHGGQYNFKKIIENNETIGYEVTKHHWTEITGLRLQKGYQKIIIPGAKNMSINQDFFLKDRFNITYDLNGQRRLDKYHFGFAGDQCKLANQYIINEEGEKIKIK